VLGFTQSPDSGAGAVPPLPEGRATVLQAAGGAVYRLWTSIPAPCPRRPANGSGHGAEFGQHAQAPLRLGDIGVVLVPGVAGEDRADHAADLRLGLLVVDHVLEAAVVPA